VEIGKPEIFGVQPGEIPGASGISRHEQDWIKIETLDKESTQGYFDLLYKEEACQKKVDTTKLYYDGTRPGRIEREILRWILDMGKRGRLFIGTHLPLPFPLRG